jgi:molybdate transport system substrate-binding protein
MPIDKMAIMHVSKDITMVRQYRSYIYIATALLLSQFAYAEEKITVFAAASLTNVLTEISNRYASEQQAKVTHSFAASSALAKQIENGAPADVFISADTKWMTYLQDKKLINVASRKTFLGNKLVLIAPKGRGFDVKFDQSVDLSKAFKGKLCTGDVDSVPAGIYAKESLTALGWWDDIKARIVGAQDVRGALAFVERGECTAGIVYETDAKVSDKVVIVGVFPENTHQPIVYPVAVLANAKAAGTQYVDYLSTEPILAIFKKYGFSILK